MQCFKGHLFDFIIQTYFIFWPHFSQSISLKREVQKNFAEDTNVIFFLSFFFNPDNLLVYIYSFTSHLSTVMYFEEQTATENNSHRDLTCRPSKQLKNIPWYSTVSLWHTVSGTLNLGMNSSYSRKCPLALKTCLTKTMPSWTYVLW